MNSILAGSALLPLIACVLPSVAASAEGPRPPSDASTVLLQQTGSLIAELSTDKKTAALKTAFPAPDDDHLLRVNVSGPFDEAKSQAVVGDLDRFASMATVEIGYEQALFESLQRWAVSARVGGRSFKYADPADLANDKKEDHVSYGFGLTWSHFLTESIFKEGALVGARVRYERAYEGQPEQQLCTSIDETQNLRCRSTGAAAPKETHATVLQAQIATSWRSLGVSLLASHDLKSDDTGLELPVYLIRDDKTGLFTGGIKLSWRSEEDDLRAILFIGVPLGTF